MTIRVSETTRNIVCESLDIDRLSEVIDMSYGGFSTTADVDREKTKLYSDSNRGSVRLNTGRYYTAKEYEERINRIKNMKLPY
ncbi:MAG: hypothetical protein ACOYOE_01765 [Chlorobium sp.]